MMNTTEDNKLADAIVDGVAYRPSKQSMRLERTYRFEDGETVRVRVHRDSYSAQCWGAAEVLAFDRSWTHLTVADPAVIDTYESPYAAWGVGPECLGPVADELAVRAARILNVL